MIYQKKTPTYLEHAVETVPGFGELMQKLERSFSINGKVRSTLNNYGRCLAHMALHFKVSSPVLLDKEQVQARGRRRSCRSYR